ncbi:MAG: tRNA (N6-threonylcarbamoyladenosine(37)-N6)-methyltransferase TrmO [Lachnospiraceae bacterium]|nr:tRNA (N6-threonylcarbamoyladenosine(37)-N6)-methyltransferase TrmO [Lachnospiraceae bacterium]
MKVIARIYTDFPEKFGIPRQSGLIEELKGRIVFEKKYRSVDAVRGLEDFSHIWLIWQFSEAVRDKGWSATVRPPLLGGNTRMGVFATRSPFRPNPIGLSCVKLERIEFTEEGPVLIVAGADLMNGTPIYDIKPYLPYADSKPDAVGGFTENLAERRLEVEISEELLDKVPVDKREALIKVLEADPRPSYQSDPERVYGMSFAGLEIKFSVSEYVLHVQSVDCS